MQPSCYCIHMTNNKYPGTSGNKRFDRIMLALGWLFMIATIVLVALD